MTRILLTGANGHIGAQIARGLLARGHEVIAFVRPDANLRGLKGLDVTYKHGDVKEAAMVAHAAEGAQAIIHTAAVYRTNANDPQAIIQPALMGARNILVAAHSAGIRRVVYTGSVAAVGTSRRPNEVRTAEDWNDHPSNPYYIAKTRSEREAVNLAEKNGTELIRICPGLVLGPYDFRITPSNRVIANLANNATPGWIGSFSFSDVRDVAAIHIAALEKGRPGARYIAAGQSLTIREIETFIRVFTGLGVLHLDAPRWLSLLVARLAELLMGVNAPFTYTEVYENVKRYGLYDSTPAIEELGVIFRPVEETVRDSLRWLYHMGALKRHISPAFASALKPDPAWER